MRNLKDKVTVASRLNALNAPLILLNILMAIVSPSSIILVYCDTYRGLLNAMKRLEWYI